MVDTTDIFEKNYKAYCSKISKIDLTSIQDILGLVSDDGEFFIPLFDTMHSVSGGRLLDRDANRENRVDYMISVILAKYLILCPDKVYHEAEWVAFKDFKRISHFKNVNFFSNDTEQAIEKHFSGKLKALAAAAEKIGGIHYKADMPYDLIMQFNALPRISLLLLFNDIDDEFPAKCTVLFQKHAEFYLDPESLAMTGAYLALKLKKALE